MLLFWVFGHEAGGMLAPRSGIEPATLNWGGIGRARLINNSGCFSLKNSPEKRHAIKSLITGSWWRRSGSHRSGVNTPTVSTCRVVNTWSGWVEAVSGTPVSSESGGVKYSCSCEGAEASGNTSLAPRAQGRVQDASRGNRPREPLWTQMLSKHYRPQGVTNVTSVEDGSSTQQLPPPKRCPGDLISSSRTLRVVAMTFFTDEKTEA